MKSRNQREGKYVGTWQNKHIRRLKDMPGLIFAGANKKTFPPYKPFVDSAIAWVTYRQRHPEVAMDFSNRYITKADRHLYDLSTS